CARGLYDGSPYW
nr:immunoglobulin heavy chain junction region [Mus musculus]